MKQLLLLWWHVLLLTRGGWAEIAGHEDTCRAKGDDHTCGGDLSGTDMVCEGKVELEELAAVELGEDCIFFIESSPKEVLSSREACALESAARNSELRVVMVRLGRSLDLADNTTCQVYNRLRDVVSLYYINPDKIAENTPLEKFFQSTTLASSRHRYVHTADALRLLLISKYGGFYADSDFVILKSLKSLKNVIASDQVSGGDEYNDAGELLVGDTVTNAIFHLSRGSALLQLAISTFSAMFDPQGWAKGGPDVLQRALLTTCGFAQDHQLRTPMTRERFSREQCGGVQVLDYKSFFPVGWMNQHQLSNPKRSRKEWYELFRHSSGVHFYHSSSQSGGKVDWIKRPRFYGARKPAYLVLALDHCPISYWSKDNKF